VFLLSYITGTRCEAYSIHPGSEDTGTGYQREQTVMTGLRAFPQPFQTHFESTLKLGGLSQSVYWLRYKLDDRLSITGRSSKLSFPHRV